MKPHLDRMGEALTDGKGDDLDCDPLGQWVLAGVEDLHEVALDDGRADAAATERQVQPSACRSGRECTTGDAPRLGKLVGVTDELCHVDVVGRS